MVGLSFPKRCRARHCSYPSCAPDGCSRRRPLDVVREHARTELTRLPEPLRALDDADPYHVEIAPALRDLAAQIDVHT